MSMIDPTGLLHSLVDRVIAWCVVIGMGIGVLTLVIYLLVTYWLLFVGIAIGFGGCAAWQARRTYW